MSEVRFVDTTIRDGNQSLWGFRMTTGMILPIAEQLDRAGFEALEADTLICFKMRVREQREEPWERLKLLSKKITRTPLTTMSGVGMGEFNIAPLAYGKLRLERMAAYGVKRAEIQGFLNDMSFRVPEVCRFAREAGMQVILAITYSLSPKHTDAYYAQKTLDAVKLKPDRLYLKDPGGLLTPERVRTIIPAIQKNSHGIPVELHTHCTTGLGPLCYLEAIRQGITTLHTGIPPLANGSAQPSVLNVARNARLLGHTPILDERAVEPVAEHFFAVARAEGLPVGAPVEYDYGQYLHQIPGGVIANLKRQLGELRVSHLLEKVMEEVIEVRKDFGYPIMVTPFSQHVVTQAMINVTVGERYREVTDESIQYALGYWGKEAGAAMAPETRDRILDRARARELAAVEPREPSIREIRQKLGGPGISDDELILRYIMGGEEELKAMRPASPITEYLTARSPIVTLVKKLLKQDRSRYIHLEKGNLKLRLQKF